MSITRVTPRWRVHKFNVLTYVHNFRLLQASCYFFASTLKTAKSKIHHHHGAIILPIFSVSYLPNQGHPKPQPSGATRGHIASINRSDSSLLQRFVVLNQPHNTSLHKKYRWCMHNSPPALCCTYTTQSAAVALPTADLDGRGGGWRLSVQICRHRAFWALGCGGNLSIFLTFEVPQKQTPTQQYNQNAQKNTTI